MNKEKISDFVDVWAQTVELTEIRYINVIKSDIAKFKSLDVNVGLLDSKINDKATRHKGLQGKSIQIIKKTIEHELGHCFKSSFTDGYKAPIGRGREQDTIYENLINNLQSYKNGKYSSQIKAVQELNPQGESEAIKTGVHDAKANYNHDYRVQWIDELLNETEALELTNSNEVHEKWALQDENGRDSASGNYVDVYNYMSGYSTFTGYGSILKTLLGKEEGFYAEYISSVDIFKKFDEEYADIIQDVWRLDPNKYRPMQCIFIDFDDFHNIVFNNIKTRINELSLQENRPKINGEQETYKQEDLQQDNQQFTKADSTKMKFIKGFIQAYNDTEEEYQYEKRANTDIMDIKRLKDIIETKGMNRMLTADLDGKWIGTPDDEDFKVQYSQKQVSAMARLLKVAQLLTESKKLNPEGRNYLEEFVDVPNIEYKLKQMRADLDDENSYMYELRQRARDNRQNGTKPTYPSTQAEIDASDDINPVLSPKQTLDVSGQIADFESQVRVDLSRDENLKDGQEQDGEDR